MALQSTHRRSADASADLAFAEAEERAAKIILARKVNAVVAERRLCEAELARLVGMRIAKLAAIRDYRLRGISLDRLMRALVALGQPLSITVAPAKGRAHLDVAA